jgi:Secretion system C-terminal sorting domain
MKKIITAFLLILAGISAKAQTEIDTTAIANALMQSPYIFEGKVIERCGYKDASTGNIFTNNIIELTKIIKGNLTCGTVSIITEGGQAGDDIQHYSHTTQYNYGVTGIFFCKTSPYAQTSNCTATTNIDELTPVHREFGEIHYYNDFINEVAMGLNSQFHDITELYDFLQNILGLNVVDCNSNFNVKNWASNNRPMINKIPFVAQDDEFKKTRAGNEVKFTLDSYNLVYGAGATKYFECKVRAQANDSTKFLHKGAFRLKYNPKAFGTFIASNVTLTLDPNFPSSVYGNVQIIDKSDSVISFIITQTTGSRTKLLTTPKMFFTLKIPMDSCNYFPTLHMIDTFATIKQFNLFTTIATGTTTTQYDSVFARDDMQGTRCEPVITDVYSQSTLSKNVAGGINEKVVIKGSNFGNVKGKLLLPNADNGGATFLQLENAYDVNTWTDTQIVYTLPGIILDTAYNQEVPGSGRHRIVNKWKVYNDTLASANDSIIVKYSLLEWSNFGTGSSYFKSNRLLFPPYSDSSYTFKLDTSITNSQMIGCIRAAINKWRCLTGINIKLIEAFPTNNAIAPLDLKNTIKLVPLSSGVVANAIGNIKQNCTSSTSQPPFPVMDMDIRINRNELLYFQYDTTGVDTIKFGKTDFYYAILHELGHALELNHVISTSDILNFETKTVPTYPINRGINLNFNNQTGGDSVRVKSQRISSYGLNCTGFPMKYMPTQDTACRTFPMAINNNFEKPNFVIDIFPNPFQHELNINFSQFEKNAHCEIFDFNGKSVYKSQLNNIENKIQLQNLSAGIYLIKIQNNKTWVAKKVICIQ